MKSLFLLLSLLCASLTLTTSALAKPQFVRWTVFEDSNPELQHILEVVNAKTGFHLDTSDFVVVEDRDLARQHFLMLAQVAQDLPIRSASIRIWTDLTTKNLVQVEANVESETKNIGMVSLLAPFGTINDIREDLSSEKTFAILKSEIKKTTTDSQTGSVHWSDQWFNDNLVRFVEAKGRRGKHFLTISLTTHKAIDYTYEEFPQGDLGQNSPDEFSIPAKVFPIYEQSDGSNLIHSRVDVNLDYIKKTIHRSSNNDPYAPIRTQRYFEDKQDPILGELPMGRAKGYWSIGFIKRLAGQIKESFPAVSNEFGRTNAGVILEGRYASINIHPAAAEAFKDIDFTMQKSSQFKPDWVPVNFQGREVWEMIPSSALLGKPLTTGTDAFLRPARRLPDHDPTSYINDGFDEVQVYYAINRMMESFHEMGFIDPELSTRPFNAYLYDPDVSMRDNAYYTDDTINFTTYSPNQPNYARDNATIWHELGHGLMDRLMGDSIRLADTGGLSEGMADFVADLIVQDVTDGKPFEGSDRFRIMNQTGFFLTNEVHDDGEAYGGAMHDLLKAAIAKEGRTGLYKVADLVLESMRLSRNHPALTAQDWFNHMLFADQLGSDLRSSGELRNLVVNALNGRNYSFDTSIEPASFHVLYKKSEVEGRASGTRSNPVPVEIGANETKTFHLDLSVKNSSIYGFKFPVKVKVVFQKGPLQGAVHWKNEEQEPWIYTLNSENEALGLDFTVSGTCDSVNLPDGGCKDYAYLQIWNDGETQQPQAKKRFYVRINNP